MPNERGLGEHAGRPGETFARAGRKTARVRRRRAGLCALALAALLPAAAHASAESVAIDTFDLPPGASITIEFEVTIDNPVVGGATQVCNQGQLLSEDATGSPLTPKLTDDPDLGGAADPTCTQLLIQADLALVKADTPDPVNAGAALGYTLAVTNNGPSTATSVTVTDTLPAGVGFVSASGTGWSCNEVAGVVTCTRPSLAIGAAPVITVNVTAPAEGGVISNSAVVGATESDPVPGNNADLETTTVTAVADLAVAKADSVDPVDATAALSYTVSVANNGPSTATSVTLTDTLPAGVSFVSASGTGWTCNEVAGVVSCTRPSLAVGAAPTITINVTAPADGGVISNSVSVGATETDAVPGNNTANETTTVTASADLEVTKADSVDPVAAGAALGYTVTVTNSGPSMATSVVVTDTLPAGVNFVSASGSGWSCGEAAGVVTCTRPSLAVGAAPDITIAVTTPDEGGVITNSVSVDAAEDDPTAGNDSDTETTTVTASTDLEVTKADSADPVAAGASLIYTVAVTNNGPSTATSVVVSDTLPAGVTFVNASGTGWSCGEALGVVTCTRPSLAVDAAPDITIAVTTPDEGGVITNSVSVDAAEDDPAAGNDNDTETTTVTATADLEVTKADSVDPVAAGDPLSYAVTVTNSGPSMATSVVVTDTLPAGVNFVSAGGTGWSCGEALGVVTCTRPSLAVGPAPAITIAVTAPAEGGVITNTVSVDAAEDDPAAGNDSDSEPTTVTAVADLHVTKADSADPTIAGTSLTYTVTVTNNGPSTAQDVVVADTLPGQVTLVSTTGCAEDPGGIPTCTLGTIAASTSKAMTITVDVEPDAVGPLSNTASVTSSTTLVNTGDDDAVETTAIGQEADLALSKTAVPAPGILSGGQALTYTVTVTNDGPSTASGVVVTDALPAGLQFQTTSGDCAEGANAVPTCTLGTLAPGASKGFTISTTVDPTPPALITNTATVAGSETDPVPGNNSDEVAHTTDSVAPTLVAVDTVPGDGALVSCETVRTFVNRLRVTFSEAMLTSSGVPGPNDADNPGNYLLLGSGPDRDFSTTLCGSPQGDDVAIPITAADYAADTPSPPQSRVTLRLAGALPNGLYRFLVCASGLQDLAGNALDGDGDGTGGDDSLLDRFRIDSGNLFANGHLDCDAVPWLADPPAAVVYDPATDEAGSPLSGSASIPSTVVDSVDLAQCIDLAALAPGSLLRLAGRYRVDAPGTAILGLAAACELSGGPSCAGPPAGALADAELISGAPGVWATSPTFELVLPAGVMSGRCGLGLENPLGATFSAWLDHLSLKQPAEIFADGFESGDVSAWSRSSP